MSPRTSLLYVFAFISLVGVFAVVDPTVSQDQEGGFSDVIDVRVVNLEVVVTNKSGVRVTALKPADFRLRVDGKEVPIEFFSEVAGGIAVEREGKADTAGLPFLSPGEPVGTSYLLFIDDFFSESVDRDRVLEGFIDQLPNLGVNDRMAVVAFDGRKLEMLSTWSGSVEGLARTLKDARLRDTHGLKRAAYFRNADRLQDSGIDDNFLIGRADVFRELNIGEREAAQRLIHDVRRSVLAATSALRGFAGPPGRRVMLLLSGGWPYDPVKWVLREEASATVGRELFDSQGLFEPLVDAANRLSYTLYPIDVPGKSRRTEIASADVGEEGQFDQLRLFEREQEEEYSLTSLARETGGQALLDSDRLAAFEKVAEDTRSYYWIGFTPAWKGKDESHDIEIESLVPGLKVRSRGGFSDLSRQTEVTMMVESTLLFGDAPSSEPLVVRMGTLEKAGVGRVIVPLSVFIPMNSLIFLPAAEGYVAQTELRIAVLDEKGNNNDVPVIPLELVLKAPPKEGEIRRYETAVKLRKQKHDVVVSLYDTLSGKILSSRLEVDPR